MVLGITYQLKNKQKDYTPLFNAIKLYNDWLHIFDDTWFIYAKDKTTTQIANEIRPYMEENDVLLVYQMDIKNKYGWLSKTAWEWFDKYTT